jgi:hypothetical protein
MRLQAMLAFSLFAVMASLLTAQGREIRGSISPVKDPLILHEPVIVRLVIENPLDQAVKFDLGPWSYGSLSATLKRPDGQVVRGSLPMGFSPPGNVTLAPHSSYEAPLLANRWFDFDQTGTYVLDVAIPGPIRNERGAALPHSIKGQAIVNVGLRDPEQLQRICADLAERVTKEIQPTEDGVRAARDATFAADALSYVKDAVAVPFLAGLLGPDGRYEDRGVQGLARIADRSSIDVLISHSAARSDYVRTLSREALSRIERTTNDIAIKQRIQDALR